MGLVYPPLEFSDSIRLIQLEPAPHLESVLKCTLISSRLQSTPDFEAISYVWGQPTFTETLRTSSGDIDITPSLAAALRHFRLPARVRNLWADAVCINQSDGEEKSVQVAQMGDIYRCATRVLAWLGPGTDETHQAMLDCAHLYPFALKYHMAAEDTIDMTVFRKPRLSINNGTEKETPMVTWDLMQSEHRDAILSIVQYFQKSKFQKLTGLPWFSRLWVIQEVGNSSVTSLHCGQDSLEWHVFASVMKLMYAIANMDGPGLHITKATVQEIMTSNFERAFNVVRLRDENRLTRKEGVFCMSLYRQFGNSLHKAISHGCSDDRDRIYGLLSLCGNLAQDRGITIKPDYSKAVTEVYRDFTLQYLKPRPRLSTSPTLRDVRILYDAGLWRRSFDVQMKLTESFHYAAPDYLPSWVPEYRPQYLDMVELPWSDAGFNTRWHTCPPQVYDLSDDPFFAQFHFCGQPNVIGIGGTLVDKLETITRTSLPGEQRSSDIDSTIPSTTAEAPYEGLSMQSIAKILFQIRRLLFHLLPDNKYFNGEDIRAALVRTLLVECSHPEIMRILWDWPNQKDEAEMIALWDTFEDCCINPDGELVSLYRKAEESAKQPSNEDNEMKIAPVDTKERKFSPAALKASEFVQAIDWVLARSNLVVSTKGLLALVPKAARQYDSIVQFAGTHMPYVVRSLGNSNLCHLIGPCYVHGYMHCPSLEHDFEISRHGGVICLV
ncbi:heterokaryon incompatibility protein-domain-containing protein [Pyrenochaeta sp. MPI-SDFR-AT-0127]|nr:heterokaryon incompatibility protein-domain-containing protein [Pyrenochaeta sp. MPI-SDFR-AT-0127]